MRSAKGVTAFGDLPKFYTPPRQQSATEGRTFGRPKGAEMAAYAPTQGHKRRCRYKNPYPNPNQTNELRHPSKAGTAFAVQDRDRRPGCVAGTRRTGQTTGSRNRKAITTASKPGTGPPRCLSFLPGHPPFDFLPGHLVCQDTHLIFSFARTPTFFCSLPCLVCLQDADHSARASLRFVPCLAINSEDNHLQPLDTRSPSASCAS